MAVKVDFPITERTIDFPETPKTSFSLYQWILRVGRFAFWCIVNFLIWPISRPFVKKFKLIDVIFVVYPGTKEDAIAYAPLWFQRIAGDYFFLSVIGMITPGQGKKRGIIVAVAKDPTVFSEDGLRMLMQKIQIFVDITGAKSIALAGRLPGIFLANNIPVYPPFRKGEQGTVFTVIETIRRVAEREEVSLNDTIGVLGIGFIGARVLTRLDELGYFAIGFDPRAKGSLNGSRRKITNDMRLLSSCKMVVVLTAKGADISGSVSYLRKGVIVIDDTHPQLPSAITEYILRVLEGKVYKTALGLTGMHFVPEIPGYNKDWLPGCVIEALVFSNGHNGTTQDSFDRQGRDLGLKPFLISPRG